MSRLAQQDIITQSLHYFLITSPVKVNYCKIWNNITILQEEGKKEKYNIYNPVHNFALS